eukprot:TRINITY_DN12212_c0_g1_i1.p1 TRINITY_DN12212_c0_g1~~TRINITY_DN12212_c0_g1_i1.p1  ORF type:complete len:168 (+),score=35.79 TRINITY_DN12212_c0_g1_i1:73-576(+)
MNSHHLLRRAITGALSPRRFNHIHTHTHSNFNTKLNYTQHNTYSSNSQQRPRPRSFPPPNSNKHQEPYVNPRILDEEEHEKSFYNRGVKVVSWVLVVVGAYYSIFLYEYDYKDHVFAGLQKWHDQKIKELLGLDVRDSVNSSIERIKQQQNAKSTASVEEDSNKNAT